MAAFRPDEHWSRCEAYLRRALGGGVRLLRAEPLSQSTREAPWRLDVEVDGLARSVVLRIGAGASEHEYRVLRAMESVPIPVPRAYGWDPEGDALGCPAFVCDYIEGESLLAPMLAGEPWAEALYLDTVCALQAVTWEQMAPVADRFGSGETAADWLEGAYACFEEHPQPLAEAVYSRLKQSMPQLLEVRFSNGDLWLDNVIARQGQLAGVIDFENAGFSDPIYEFLLAFFVAPELRGRGIEERYCQRMGFDAAVLPWYRGLEYLDTWGWTLTTGRAFVHYTAEGLGRALETWLAEAG